MIDTIKTTTDLLQWFLKNESELVKQMSKCDHNFDKDHPNPFHSEGSIFTHSVMVLKEADRNHLSIELKIAALLHDIGKHVVAETVEETKKVRFFNHDGVSAFMALDIMDKLQLNKSQKEHIFKLIALHTQPFKQDLLSLQQELQDYGLYYSLLKLSEADKNGRFHTGENTPLDFNFISTPRKTRQYEKTVTLLVGLPYSGKSTYVENEVKDGTVIVSRDVIIESIGEGANYNEKWKSVNQDDVDEALKDVFELAKRNTNVVVDMTHMSKKSRRRTLAQFGKEWGRECIVFLPSLTTINQRTLLRKDKYIDSKVIGDMIERFYPPVYGEGFDKIEYRME